MIFDVRNPLHLRTLMIGRAQPLRAWRQRQILKLFYDMLAVMIICRHIVKAMTLSKAEQVARLVRKAGVFRPRELDRVGIPREYLRQAKDRGLVRQVGRGLYVADGSRVTEHHTLVEATKRVPHVVICLLSALRFHGLTTQSPHEVWMA